MVRYHNLANFGISYAAFPSASQFAAQPAVNVTTELRDGSNMIKLLTRQKLINKENSRSEIWHYFSYKTDDKGEGTDHRTQHVKSS